MAVLTGMEASVRSVGQGHPATFYGPLLQTLTISTLYNFLIQSKGPVFTYNVSKCNLFKKFNYYIFFNKNYMVLSHHIVY